ncbi:MULTISPECIES: TraR/DksA C4-type zinc finger protein [Virgibacillus]|uniref:hypothetical protein n=1 Tax=Virgibacillus TaxID=84406 RepID=UPI00038886C2|nr:MULTISPECIES: hypothetical protein [Virgibacillus]EQB37265.1 hypothetical protein M948_01650 [Virgibacillus sp. CM-4]MYL40022.1 hypothetical protein [Virgibacillus massiliensis]
MSKHLSQEKIAELKSRLLYMKKEIENDLAANDPTSPNEAVEELADYDNHPADMGTEQFEQERDAGVQQIKEDQLQDIKEALAKIEKGNYGVSEISGKPIPIERLEAQPTARYLVEEK